MGCVFLISACKLAGVKGWFNMTKATMAAELAAKAEEEEEEEEEEEDAAH